MVGPRNGPSATTDFWATLPMSLPIRGIPNMPRSESYSAIKVALSRTHLHGAIGVVGIGEITPCNSPAPTGEGVSGEIDATRPRFLVAPCGNAASHSTRQAVIFPIVMSARDTAFLTPFTRNLEYAGVSQTRPIPS